MSERVFILFFICFVTKDTEVFKKKKKKKKKKYLVYALFCFAAKSVPFETYWNPGWIYNFWFANNQKRVHSDGEDRDI